MSETTTTANVETTEAPKVEPVDLAALSAADRKTIERVFGVTLPKAGTARLTTKRPAVAECGCGTGCGKTTASEFASGHDMRRKSNLRLIAEGQTPNFPNVEGITKAAAKAELARRGW